MNELGGVAVAIALDLPPEGVDLRAELAAHTTVRVRQALGRAGDDLTAAARLLRVSPLEFARLSAGAQLVLTATPATPPSDPRSDGIDAIGPSEFSRIEGGREVISRAAIRRLAALQFTARQIADRFGVNELFIEKVLRAEAELAKCEGRSA